MSSEKEVKENEKKEENHVACWCSTILKHVIDAGNTYTYFYSKNHEINIAFWIFMKPLAICQKHPQFVFLNLNSLVEQWSIQWRWVDRLEFDQVSYLYYRYSKLEVLKLLVSFFTIDNHSASKRSFISIVTQVVIPAYYCWCDALQLCT